MLQPVALAPRDAAICWAEKGFRFQRRRIVPYVRKAEFTRPEGPDGKTYDTPEDVAEGGFVGDRDRSWAKLGVREYAEQRFKWTEGRLQERSNREQKKQQKVERVIQEVSQDISTPGLGKQYSFYNPDYDEELAEDNRKRAEEEEVIRAAKEEEFRLREEKRKMVAKQRREDGTFSTLKAEAEAEQLATFKQLLEVFSTRPITQWRQLIVFAEAKFCPIATDFTAWIDEQADECDDVNKQLEMYKTSRKLRELNEEVVKHAKIVDQFNTKDRSKWREIVGRNFEDLGEGFEVYLASLSNRERGTNEAEADRLMEFGKQIFAEIDDFRAEIGEQQEDWEGQEGSDDPAKEIQEFAGSLMNAVNEIASQQKIDPNILRIGPKAFTSMKLTDANKEEALDGYGWLMKRGRQFENEMMPKEYKIIKMICFEDSPQTRLEMLDQALTPGVERMEDGVEWIWSTPDALIEAIDLLSTYMLAFKKVLGQQRFAQRDTRASVINPMFELYNQTTLDRMQEMKENLRRRYM